MSERQMLSLGSGKLGSAVHHWALPPVDTCPGATSVCQSSCYARSGRYSFKAVQDKLAWNFEQAQQHDFYERMIHEIKSQGVLVLRIHSAGDFFSQSYAEKWYIIMRKCPKVRFYFYSRSWRVPEIEPVLYKMAQLKCCRAWYSVDSEATIKAPRRVRLAYLQTKAEALPPVDLVLRVRKLRSTFALPVVCMAETPQGKGSNCGSCGRCYR